MRCPQCGQPLENGLDVCLFCGARTPPAQGPGAAPRRASKLNVVDGVIQPLRPYQSDMEAEQERLRARLTQPEGPVPAAARPPHRSGNGSIPGLKRVDGVIQPLRPYQDDAPPAEPTAAPASAPAGFPVFQPPPRRQLRNGAIPGVKMVDGVIQPLRPYQGSDPAEPDPTAPPDRPGELLGTLPLPPARKPQVRQNGAIPGLKRVDGVIQPLRPYQGGDPAEPDPTAPPDRPGDLLEPLPLPPPSQDPTSPPAREPDPWKNWKPMEDLDKLENWEDWLHLFR